MERKWKSRLMHGIALSTVLACLTIGNLFAQTVNGAFHGVITDQTGAVIPEATVVIKNLSTGVTRQVVTDSTGFYAVTQIPPARYSITASKAGFTTAVVTDVDLQVNEDRVENSTLQVGQTTQQVSVVGAAAALNTSTSTLGTVVGSQQVVDLPLNGRQFTQMILLSPGAAPMEAPQQPGQVVSIGGGGISPSINGQNGRQNNFTLDGGFNNEIFHNAWAISPPPDAIQEFKIQSHTVDAQFGMEPGSNVNVVTKSGSNALHGDAWEFLRNDKMDAANFFDNFSNSPKPAFRQNQFGFTIGGPVLIPGKYDGREKKTYFFGYYEGFRSAEGFTEFANVPTPGELGGNFSDILTTNGVGTDPLSRTMYQGQIYNPYSTRQVTAGVSDPVTGLIAQSTGLVRDPFPGNAIPINMLNAQALAYISGMFPQANYGPGGNSFPNIAVASSQKTTDDQFGVKLEHAFGNNDTLFGAFYLTNPYETLPTAIPSNRTTLKNDARTVSIGYTHLFSPTLLMTLHYGYTYENEPLIYGDQGSSAANLALLQATNQLGLSPEKDGFYQQVSVNVAPRLSGTFEFAVPNGPFRSQVINADMQKIAGHHTLGVGYLGFHIHSFDDGWGFEQNFDQFPSSAIVGGGNASSTGDGLASMLLNTPSALFGFLGQTAANVTDLWQGIYLQDKWQVSKKLSVTMGLRYDYVPPVTYFHNQISGWSNNCSCFLMAQPYGVNFPFANVRPRYYDPQWREFQPRFGLAYKATSSLVLRAGFALFTDHGGNLIQQSQDDRIAWPWGVEPNLNSLNRAIPDTFFGNPTPSSSYFPSPTSPPYVGGGSNNENKSPTSNQWNLGVEELISSNTTLSVDYVGSRDNHLFISETDNSPIPSKMGPGPIAPRAQWPNTPYEFGYDTDIGYSSYNALQAKIERRYTQGLTFTGSYTWSHSLDMFSNPYGSTLPNPYDLRSNYGNSDFDFRNLLTVNFVYRLPWGRGQEFGSTWSRGVDAALGGWRTSGILTAHTGSPFTVTVPFDNANTGTSSQHGELVGNPKPSGFKQGQALWYDPTAFAVPTAYTYGDLGRNTLTPPGLVQFDFSLSKDFKFTESRYLQFRAESFNLTNRVNFGNPNSAVGGPNFMEIFGANTAREIQLALKLFF